MQLIGMEIRATDKLGRTTEWKIADRLGTGQFLLIAINETDKEYRRDLEKFKKMNPLIQSVQDMTMETFGIIEVEPAWFNFRKIQIIGGVA